MVSFNSVLVIHIICSLDQMISVSSSNKFEGSSRTEVANIANQTAYNVSKLLDNLLQEYDNVLRPDFGGPSLLIEVNMQVRSMGPISEMDMSYIMDCYFRQSWVDKRLSFEGYKDALALNIEMLRKIWKPDTYVYNGKKSYLHTITTPNRFVRLFPNGRVLYSQRLTIRATCIMNLEDFPMDKQRCPLKIGSFGYTADDVSYRWTTGRGVNIASDMKLSQFDLISTPTGNETTYRSKGIYSTLLVSFHLQRHMGDFVIQVYGPCILLVVISWVSFWLNREATSDRISLGITTVLTMTFLGLEARKDLPKVPYPTALDYFVFISFTYIFSTVVQFGVVHYFTKVGSGEYYLDELEDEPCPLAERRRWERKAAWKLSKGMSESSSTAHFSNHMSNNTSGKFNLTNSSATLHSLHNLDHNSLNHHPGAKYFSSMPKKSRNGNGFSAGNISFLDRLPSLENIPSIFTLDRQLSTETEKSDDCTCKRCVTRAMNDSEKALNSVSKIDTVSRIVFPSTYIVINIIYWYMYLDKSERIDLTAED